MQPPSAFIIILAAAVLSAGCTKTKTGIYKLVVDGISYEVEGRAVCCDTTKTRTTRPYHVEKNVNVSFVGTSDILINGQVWIRDGNSILYEHTYDTNSDPVPALGGSTQEKETYNGVFISKALIKRRLHVGITLACR